MNKIKIFYINTSGIGYIKGHIVKAYSLDEAKIIIENTIKRKIEEYKITEIPEHQQVFECFDYDREDYEG